MDNLKRSIFAWKAKTPFHKSLLKATFPRDYDASKEKHVKVVINGLYHPSDQAHFSLLVQRLTDKGWAAVLKTLILIHRSINSFRNPFISWLASERLPVSEINCNSEKGSAHAAVLKAYPGLIQQIASLVESRFPHQSLSQRQNKVQSLTTEQLIDYGENISSILKSVHKIAMSCMRALKNYKLKVTQSALYWIFIEGSGLYVLASDIYQRLTDLFFDSELNTAIAIQKYLETIDKISEKFFIFYKEIRYTIGRRPPQIVQRTPHVIKNMKSFIEILSCKTENIDTKETETEANLIANAQSSKESGNLNCISTGDIQALEVPEDEKHESDSFRRDESVVVDFSDSICRYSPFVTRPFKESSVNSNKSNRLREIRLNMTPIPQTVNPFETDRFSSPFE